MDRLDLRLVEYFVTVAEELHFGRAAERLHIAQPSLSQQIRRLESLIGVTLLDRNSRGVSLTDAGETLLREGRKILSQAQCTIQATRTAGTAGLAVGFYGSAANTLLPAALAEFRNRHPALTVSVRELLFGSIDDVLTGKIDVAFTRLLPGQTELEVEILTTETRLAVLPDTHPLAARESVIFADLKDENFIINPAIPNDPFPARWLAEQRRHGLPGRIAARATSVQEILTLVAAGRGIAIVPAAVATQQPRAHISYVPVTDADPAVVSLARRPGPTNPIVESFLESARQVAAGGERQNGAWPAPAI
jgi:DNA-binding transcriptional LysR family regulator